MSFHYCPQLSVCAVTLGCLTLCFYRPFVNAIFEIVCYETSDVEGNSLHEWREDLDPFGSRKWNGAYLTSITAACRALHSAAAFCRAEQRSAVKHSDYQSLPSSH